jgi:superfamily II DNA/RNA helicase
VTGLNPPAAITGFEEANLRPILMENVQKCGYRKPTPVQKSAIPIIKSGRDLMACAQTGSGKTVSKICMQYIVI